MLPMQVSVRLVREGSTEYRAHRPQQIVAFLGEYLKDLPQENFVAVYLDTRGKLLGTLLVGIGCVNETLVDIKAIIRGALLCNACSVIVAHNHPSGDPEPSVEDRQLTQRIKEACKLFELRLLDHVVIGAGYVSFNERGWL